MTPSKDEIRICRATRRVLQYSLIWPNDDDEIKPGKWYYIRIIMFVLITSFWSGSTLIHCILTIKNNIDFDVTEELAMLVAMFGIYYMTFIYVKNQPKVAQLLRDLSNFDNFGEPPRFQEQMKTLDLWSQFFNYYTIIGTTVYNFIKLSQKSECEKESTARGLHENCGLLSPTWFPFKIDYFPVFQMVYLFIFISSQIIMKLVLIISYNALEIGQHIILRINHLNGMIISCFDDDDYGARRGKLKRCIEYHKEILGFVNRLDDCFTTGMLVHLTMTAAICACIEKQFVNGVNRLCAIIHISGWMIALFVACFGGQSLLDASNTIPEAIWSSKWYLADPNLRKDLLFILMRSQKELHLTVGPFGVLSYALFLSVIKMSYSILCLLTS